MDVAVGELASAIETTLLNYDQDVTDKLKAECRKAASDAAKELKGTSPSESGEYASGWRSTTVHEDQEDIRIVVHNGKKPQLTHLLEFGHVSKNGTKRIYGNVKAYPHIADAEQHVIDKLEGAVKVALKG